MNSRFSAGIIVLLLASAALSSLWKKEPTLQGAWKTVKVQEDGRSVSDDDVKARDLTITFDGNRVITREKSSDGVLIDPGDGITRIDPKTTPMTLDILCGDVVLLGIYKIEGNTLTVCARREADGSRPWDFESKEGSKITLMVLERLR